MRFDSVCRLSFRDYFGKVLDGIEKDQVILPGSVTEFQKLKGVKERMRKVKNYKREKDLKLAGGILAMGMFIGLSTATVLAAGTGYDQVHNMLYEATAVSEKLQMDPLPVYTEVEGVLTAEEEQNAVVMPVKELRDGSFSVDWNVPAGQTYMTAGFSVSSGTIRVRLIIEPDYETIEVGILKPDGTTTSIDAEDMAAHNFTASTEGTYKFYIKNTGSEEVSVTGTVKY